MTRERAKLADAPVTYEKDEDGNVIYPRTEDGHAGGAFTPDFKDVENKLPLRPIRGEARSDATRPPVNLPPGVEVSSADGVRSYVFVASEAGRQAGFAPTTPLGVDDGGNSAVGAVSERAWAVAGEMQAAIRAYEEKLRGNDKARGLPGDGHADMVPMAGALHVVGSYPGSDEELVREFRRAEDEAYYREADRIAVHETAMEFGHAGEVVPDVPLVPRIEAVKPERAAGKRRRARKKEPAPEAPAPD